MSKNEEFKEAFFETLDNIESNYPPEMVKKLSVWDVVIATLDPAKPYLLTLMADLELLKKVVEGMSVSTVAKFFAIPSRTVIEVCNLWGIVPLEETLDFNPLIVYNDSMSADQMWVEMNEILAIPISLEDAKTIVENIHKYYDLLDFLREEGTDE